MKRDFTPHISAAHVVFPFMGSPPHPRSLGSCRGFAKSLIILPYDNPSIASDIFSSNLHLSEFARISVKSYEYHQFVFRFPDCLPHTDFRTFIPPVLVYKGAEGSLSFEGLGK